MKVLAVVASGKKNGNVSNICGKIVEGALKAGHEAELINLHDYNFKFCTGCLSCTKTQKCILQDDFEQLFAKEKAADLIVYGTPVYSHDVAGILKNFIDRHSQAKIPYLEVDNSLKPMDRAKVSMNYMKEFNQRGPLKDKKFAYVVACSDPNKWGKQLKQISFVMKNFMENEMRGKIVGKIICSNSIFKPSEAKMEEMYKTAMKIGSMK